MSTRFRLAVAGLLLSPTVLGLAALAAPRARVAPATADLVAFAGATATSLLALVVLSRGELPRAARIALGLAAPALVALLSLRLLPTAPAVVLIAACLVAFAHLLGDLIGFNIEHPGHLLPACVVASIADVTSVFHPSGPSHAVLASERALGLLAVSFPVLGTTEFAPTIGVGDLLFIALLLAAARRHSLSWLRMALLAAAGIALAGFASYSLDRAIPALPAIGLAVVAGFPASRTLRAKDRRVAGLFMIGAAVLAAVLVASRFLPATAASGP
jgi:hypothetical protein